MLGCFVSLIFCFIIVCLCAGEPAWLWKDHLLPPCGKHGHSVSPFCFTASLDSRAESGSYFCLHLYWTVTCKCKDDSASRAANHYVLAIVCYAQRRCTVLLRSCSYHYPLPQNFFFFFFWSHVCVWASDSPATGSACAFFVSEMLVVPQPIGIHVLTRWPVVAFSSIPALMCHFLARWLPFSIISSCHAEVRSWKRTPGW